MTAWVWSVVAQITASIWRPALSSITRKSANLGTSGNCANASAARCWFTSHSAVTFSILGIVCTNQLPRPATPTSATPSFSLAW